MMVRVLMWVHEGKGLLQGGGFCTGPYVPADRGGTPKRNRGGWNVMAQGWFEGKLVEDRGDKIAVEVLTPAGRIVHEFHRCNVNMHGRIREEERRLLTVCQVARAQGCGLKVTMDQIADRMCMPKGRVFRILEKWEGRGWWDCGVGTWCGWITQEGQNAVYRN